MLNEELQLSSIIIGNKMYKLNLEILTELINTNTAKPSI